MSGREYINDIHHLPETLNHISQQCYSTHGLRIQRHEALFKYVSRSFEQRGYSVRSGAVFKVNNVKLKPDIIAYSQEHVVVIDAHVINDQFSLENVHAKKSNKYTSLTDQLGPLRPGGVRFTSLAFNWRGAASGSYFKFMTSFRPLCNNDFKVLAVCTLSWNFRYGKPTSI